MQNFTFGRKGTNWFLFAFVMLIGTLPSFGQDCATSVGDDDSDPNNGYQQSFCYLQTVEDIERTGTDTAIFETDDTVNDTQPIDSDELLTDGITYYVGSTTQDCDRVAVEVTVTAAATPDNTLFPGQDNFTISPCVSSSFTAEDLEELFIVDAGTNYSIEAYTSEFGNETVTGDLSPGESYYVAQVSSVAGECPSPRAAVGYDPTEAPSPITESAQTFCEGATVADLVAEGTEENTQAIRWYRSGNSNSPLADDVELINGEDYFASQIVNDRNDPFPPCETDPADRAVTVVTVESPDAGENASVTFNRGDGTVNLINYLNGTPDTGGTWEPGNADGTFDTATGEPGVYTYTVTAGECEDFATLTVSFDDCPVVDDTEQAFCELQTDSTGNNPRIAQVRDLMPMDAFWYTENNSTEALDPMTELVDGEDYFAGNEDASCINQNGVTVNIDEAPSAGAVTIISVCEDAAAFDVVPFINDAVQGPAEAGGTFSPEFASGTTVFDPAVDTAGRYTYAVSSENGGCEDDTTFVTFQIEDSPNAGADESLALCQSELDAIIDLAFTNPDAARALLLDRVGDRDLDGTFNYQNLLAQYQAGQQAGYPININAEYTVTNTYENAYPQGDEGTLECEDSATLSLTIYESPYAGDNTSREVSTEDDPLDLYQVLVEDSENTPDTGGTWSSGNGTFDPATDESGSFTYTVTTENDCSDSATVTITVQDEQECPIVEETTQSFCELQTDSTGNNPRKAQVRDLAPSGATWYATADSEEPLSATALLVDGATYYAGNAAGECPARTPVAVNIDEAPSAGAVTIITVCENDDAFDVVPLINEAVQGPAEAGGTFSPEFASGTTIFDPAVDQARRYTYNVASENGGCENDFTFVTINITPAEDADAGPAVQQEYCSNEATKDLYSLIPDGTTTQGTFEGYEDGNFEPANNIGTTEITYVVNPQSGCFNGVAESTYTITVYEAPNAGEDVDLEYCITDIEEMTEIEVLEIFTSLLADRDQNGFFPEGETPMDLYADFSANPIGTFSTTYTVTNSNCTDSAELSITINDTELADAGSDVGNITVCSTDPDINLFDYLSEDATQAGYFEELENGVFSPSSNGAGTYTFTFTVDPSTACVTDSDSAIYTVEVLQGPNAGENGSVEFTREDDPVNLFTYLNGTPDEGGVWTPGNADGSFDPSTGAAGTYTYTVTNENDCSDSATVSVSFEDEVIVECPEVTDTEQTFCSVVSDEDGNNPRRPNVSDLMPMNAIWYASADSDEALTPTTQLVNGETYFAGNTEGDCEERNSVEVTIEDSPSAGATTIYEICQNGEPFDIVDIMNPSTEGPAEAGGTITPALASGTTIFDPAVDTARRYTYTVASSGDTCPDDSAFITINFTESAFAGADTEVDVCMNSGAQDLFNYIDVDADTNGEFILNDTEIEDGIMNPTDFEVGTYEITYFVASENDCGEDEATITVNVLEAPEAPVTAEQVAFCAIDGATAALLEAEGTNLTWYSDADLTMMVTEEDLLVSGEYYVTQSSDEGCESEAAMITVNIVDSPAPTISTDYELCEFDNPTLAELTAEINETGEVTWYDSADSMTALSDNAMLTDGTTYYATLISDNGCESSERLAVTVTLEDCALLFPEAITPNGDGMNDSFVIENIESEYPNYNITIFNRWGSAVYKGNASVPAWDGTSNQSGSLGDGVLPVGVYFYVVDFNDGSTEPRQGRVYLNR
ncbi:gliding motility-associated-like protein [Salegentibacter sp. 24]|uniref:gliding motility-associated C-terminal domain-containing protein n=1 Tax=Salegentibacter sp. 24 TaxID=2183986 RepID=UPI0010622614|nr:gliding motility-associated C-terminal domain-containing protein [Salegentibacter sp. 24]TDN93466.1 gliding motility-associated-like protein [Salegentibacter sp. 24]